MMVYTCIKKPYASKEVLGRQIGRLQFFFDNEIKHLLDCNKINRIEGYVLHTETCPGSRGPLRK